MTRNVGELSRGFIIVLKRGQKIWFEEVPRPRFAAVVLLGFMALLFSGIRFTAHNTTKAAMRDDFTELIRALPERAMYTRSELITPQFKLAQEKRLVMYYAPFDSINPAAKLALIGVTPGWTQMEISYRIARRELLAGRSPQEAYR